MSDLQDEMRAWRGLSRLELSPIPYRNWSYRSGPPDGGMWRFNRRFLALGSQLVLLPGGYPIPIGRRSIPASLNLHASSQWKIYARAHADAALRVLAERRDLVRFWRRAYAPDESCLASILSSRELVGDVAEQLRHDRTWYIDWRGKDMGGHPRWLDMSDFPRLELERRRPALRPDDPREFGDIARKLFARKFAPDAADVLQRIDDELRT
jgi:hypothetical protein